MNRHAKENAFPAGIAALVMMLYGFAFGGIGVSPALGPFYETTIQVFNGLLKFGGLALGAVAVMSVAGLRAALLCDFLVSGLCGCLMAACAVYWTVQEKSLSVMNVLILVFGVMFIRAAFVSWSLYWPAGEQDGGESVDKAAGGGWFGRKKPTPDSQVDAPKADPIHPASIHPSSLPEEGQPPPDEGYLAALSKEDEDPPSASYE